MSEALLPWHDDGPRVIAMKIAAQTARRIVQGDLPGGELLTEVELAAEHGASRTPAREAMLQLQSWGLLRLAPKKGGIVVVPTEQERKDLIALRSMLEREAVASLDGQSREALTAILKRLLRQQRAALADSREFAEVDYQFHAQIIASAGNAVIDQLVAELAPRLVRLTHLACAVGESARTRFAAEHEVLVRCISDGDTEGFASALRTHLETGHQGYEVAR